MPVDHYENFPVASLLCPPALRPAVVALYRFARTADDLADEGCASAAERRAALARYRRALDAALGGAASDDANAWPAVFGPLAAAARRHALPAAPLHDLLSAFEQDTDDVIHPSRASLLDYARRSANPVGRLMLHLAGIGDARSLARSDAICSALQLVNFWQDLSVDRPRGRLYVPAEDAARHGLSPALGGASPRAATEALLAELGAWTWRLMAEGAPLALRVPGRLGWELRLVVQGGVRTLEKVAALGADVLHTRPKLTAADTPRLAWRALRMSAQRPLPPMPARYARVPPAADAPATPALPVAP